MPVLNAHFIVMIVISIYSVMGASFFVDKDPEHFRSFTHSVFTMFQVATFDDWGDIARIQLDEDGEMTFGSAFFFMSVPTCSAQRANAPMRQCTNAPMNRCTDARMHGCTHTCMPTRGIKYTRGDTLRVGGQGLLSSGRWATQGGVGCSGRDGAGGGAIRCWRGGSRPC